MQILETERLRLRELEERDANFLVALLNDRGFLDHIGDRGVRNAADALKYLEHGPRAMYQKYGFGLWCVERKSDGAPIGMCGILKRDALEHADLGYAFLPAGRGHGYAVEAGRATIERARTVHGLTHLVAIVTPKNADSIRVLERLGFGYERPVELTPGEKLALYGRSLVETPIVIAPADPGRPEFRRLIQELDDYLIALYPPESNHLLDIETLRQPDVRFFGLRVDGEAVGCGALRLMGDWAEIKRMYVRPGLRGQRLGARMLARLEDEARAMGLAWLRLETGVDQPEALGLYRAAGYVEREPFGEYQLDPLSLFMEKAL